MLDPRATVENLDAVRAALARRGTAAAAALDGLEAPAAARRDLVRRADELRERRNSQSRLMASADKAGAEFAAAREAMRTLGDEIKRVETDLARVEEVLSDLLLRVSNVPHPTVPDGADPAANRVERTWGEPPRFGFAPKAHWDIGAELGIIDFERASRMSGPRFAVLVGDGARLERALGQFMLDVHVGEHGYVEVAPPLMVSRQALLGTGQLPKFEEDLFRVEPGDLFLVPTAEVPVTNLHAGEIIEAPLPLRYAALTPCFRAEAGSYGKDVRGLIRQHQFNKVELVKFATPESSYDELETLTAHAEEILRRLELHYRVVSLCAGDLGFAAAKTYDIEVWLPSQDAYREISSCSNFEEFQARRARIRYRPARGAKPRLCHTLNGSALAVGRTLVAVLEQHQQADGSVRIPPALRRQFGADRIAPGAGAGGGGRGAAAGL